VGPWGIVAVTLGGCSPAEEPTTAADTSGPTGIEREVFDRLYQDRYCSEWSVCNSTGAACPIPAGTSPFAPNCGYDPVAAQACIVNDWSCEGGYPGYEYPVQPEICFAVCQYGNGYPYGYGGSGYYPF
jgi:hypothetical protein